jgi:hypothetical protein
VTGKTRGTQGRLRRAYCSGIVAGVQVPEPYHVPLSLPISIQAYSGAEVHLLCVFPCGSEIFQFSR